MFQSLKNNLIAGLMILLPIAVTIALLDFLIDLFTHPFVDLVSTILIKFKITPKSLLLLSSEQMIRYTSKALILILLFILTILLGVLTRWFVTKSIFSLTDKILHKIPVINTIYKASQELTKTVFKGDQTSFRQVVLCPFPQKGMYALGLVAREAPPLCNNLTGSELISVLIMTTPNPTSGFLLMYDKRDLVYLDIKPESAIKYIVSGGVLIPREFV